MLFSSVNFLCCRLLLRYPFHPCVTAAARKKDSGRSAKSAGGKLQLNTQASYVCGFAWSHMVHGCMVYTERAETAAVSCSTSHVGTVITPLRWILKKCAKHKHTHTHACTHAPTHARTHVRTHAHTQTHTHTQTKTTTTNHNNKTSL